MLNTRDLAATEHLVEVQVKLFGVPPPFRYSDRLLAGTRELGRPLTVDEDSLADTNGPVRITMGCRTSVQLPEFVMLFVNMQGFRVRVVRDGCAASAVAALPSPSPKPTINNDNDDDVADSDTDRWDGRQGRHNNKDPQSQISKNQGKAGGPSRKSMVATAMEVEGVNVGPSKILTNTAIS
jgi:hypothetical protein